MWVRRSVGACGETRALTDRLAFSEPPGSYWSAMSEIVAFPTPNRLDPLFLAWAAGFFDGEGCVRIGVQYKPGKSTPAMILSASISNTDPRPVTILCKAFQGARRTLNTSSRRGKPCTSAVCSLTGARAYNFIRDILPYSVVKREQIILSMEFFDLPWRRCIESRGGGHHRTPNEIVVDLDYARRISQMKHVS